MSVEREMLLHERADVGNSAREAAVNRRPCCARRQIEPAQRRRRAWRHAPIDDQRVALVGKRSVGSHRPERAEASDQEIVEPARHIVIPKAEIQQDARRVRDRLGQLIAPALRSLRLVRHFDDVLTVEAGVPPNRGRAVMRRHPNIAPLRADVPPLHVRTQPGDIWMTTHYGTPPLWWYRSEE